MIPPKQKSAIIGMRLSNKATSFSYSFQLQMHSKKDPIPQELTFDEFLKTDISPLVNYSQIRFTTRTYVPREDAIKEFTYFDSSFRQ